MKNRALLSIFLVFWAVISYAQNNVGIGTANPISKLDVRGSGINYDVFNASNDKILPVDSILVIDSAGHVGIGVTNVGPYQLLSSGAFPSAFSPQIEVWKGNPTLASSRMLGDINDMGTPTVANGVFHLYLNGMKGVEIVASGHSYFNGGYMGIGIGTGSMTPAEVLHLGGAMVVNAAVSSPRIPGTIEWNGTNFLGYDATSTAVQLDAQPLPQYWTQQTGAYGNNELLPNVWPSSISMGQLFAPNQGGMVWLPDLNAPGLFPHQLMLESTSGLQTNASMLYRMSAWAGPPWTTTILQDFSLGTHMDGTFKLYNGQVLGATNQGDVFTMFRAHPSGIIDLPNDSRVRAYQVDPSGMGFLQLIQPGQWTPVNFTMDNPLPIGYDQQIEFTLAGSPAQPIPGPPPLTENAYFRAAEEGYYQVNARCAFDIDNYYIEPDQPMPVTVLPDSYVSIAIYAGQNPGFTSSYAQGNNLQIGYTYLYQTCQLIQIPGEPPTYELLCVTSDEVARLRNNNAPNVSDVVYLKKNDIISIWVFHTAGTPMNLILGPEQLYVSIHKVS